MILDEKTEYWSETFEALDFSGQEINAKEFDGCSFKGCNFSEATFKKCNFVDCEFTQCNLSLANIDYSRFFDVTFTGSKLIGVNWTKITLPSLALNAPIKFYNCIINDSSFYGLELRELSLESCKAHDVDFREGDFSNANFTYTDFSGSIFASTILAEADFTEATNYDIDIFQNTIKQAKFCRFEAVRLLDSLGIELVE